MKERQDQNERASLAQPREALGQGLDETQRESTRNWTELDWTWIWDRAGQLDGSTGSW